MYICVFTICKSHNHTYTDGEFSNLGFYEILEDMANHGWVEDSTVAALAI